MDTPDDYQHNNGRDLDPPIIIHEFTQEVRGLRTDIKTFLTAYKDAVPFKIHVMYFVMVFALFFGIESVRFIFQLLTKYFHL